MKIPRASVTVHKGKLSFIPDFKKVITRFFQPGREQQEHIVKRILALSDKEVDVILEQTISNFTHRHDDLKRLFLDNYIKLDIEQDLSLERRLLIGSYFTMEYAIETAALLNPSIVPHPIQDLKNSNELRVILSFRAVGEGHMSSIVFREGIVRSNNILEVGSQLSKLERGKINEDFLYQKTNFIIKLKEIGTYGFVRTIMDNLLDTFTITELKESVRRFTRRHKDEPGFDRIALDDLIWFAKNNYEVGFDEELNLSGRVIFPRTKGEIKALEDARFVQFKNGNGTFTYYATYTAYDGRNILPQLIETKSFNRFKIITLMGKGAENKGMALFPEKINGKYAMLSRNDNENLYIMYSDNINYWEKPVKIKGPQYYWEFFQIGNNGSPVKTEEGWLVFTHGVGPVRTYSIGAILLDLKNPAKVIKATTKPILYTDENERDGYVPNVVYSCGSIIHNKHVVMPYAISDTRSGVATFNLRELLDAMEVC
ncbi:MAG: hypothetical protein B6D64_11805 [Bacteroidetes bacterium 4484_276]|nr:MAG: hypothetical protein B6D64_11805 [Bacteroidetes bacterium 4484_276]